MKKLVLIGLCSLTLAGCSTIKSWVPSFWDDNQSAKIVDVRLLIEKVDCTQPQLTQVKQIQSEILWFKLYSESKGWRQQDVLKIVTPMKETIDDWVKRSENQEGSKTYCEIKKKVMQQQSKRAAEAVLGRF